MVKKNRHLAWGVSQQLVPWPKPCCDSWGNLYLENKAPRTLIVTILHTHTQPFNGLLFGTTRVGRYQKKHSPTHTHPDHRTSFITFLHLQRSMASSLFRLRAWRSSRTTSLQVLFGLGPSASYSMHFFTQSSSSFRRTCPYQCSLICCNTNAMSSIPSLSQLLTWESIF